MADSEQRDTKQPDTNVWDRQTRIAVGRALLSQHPQSMSAAELAAASRKDPSNIRKIADELVAAGALNAVEPPAKRHEGRSGRKPERLFAFAPGEGERFASRFGVPDGNGMTSGDQLVFIDISSLGRQLVECLARSQVSRAKWAAVCDGKRQELVLGFEGDDAGEASLDLMAALATAEAEATRVVVSELCSGVDLMRRFRRMRDG